MPATELLDWSGEGRRFDARRTVRLGDVDPAGELRLDSVGRYLQDVASDDALDAALDNALGWVVRRTMIRVQRPAISGEDVTLTTFCTGWGRSWAERRTTIRSERGAAIDAVSLWVQLDVSTGRPSRLTDDFFAVYGPSARGRQVSSKPSLPTRPGGEVVAAGRWTFRRADLDQFGHVNNAAQLVLVEEMMGGERRGIASIEYLGAADAGVTYDLVADGPTRWLLRDGVAVTTFEWRPRPEAA